MKQTKKQMHVAVAALLLASAFSMTGCGKTESGSVQTDMERLMEDAEETFGRAGESDEAGDFADAEDYADGISDGDDTGSWNGEVYKMEIEGDDGAALNGKIRSLGISNWYVEELEEFLPQINIMPALVQNEIHPYYQENTELFDFELTQEEMERINALDRGERHDWY